MRPAVRRRRSTRTLRILSLLFLLVALVSGGFFLRELLAYRAGNQAYAGLAAQVLSSGEPERAELPPASSAVPGAALPSATGTPAPIAEGTPRASPQVSSPTPNPNQLERKRLQRLIRVDFAKLQAINPDVVGWIYGEGLDISYPVVRGQDNVTYLNRLIDGSVNKLGTIFVDYRNQPDFSDANTTLYGHNMNDGSMFHPLERYRDPQFASAHPVLYLLTPQEDYRIEVFSAAVIDPQRAVELATSFSDREERARYIALARQGSFIAPDVVLGEEDRILSLYTCDYSVDDARFLVLGKLVPLR